MCYIVEQTYVGYTAVIYAYDICYEHIQHTYRQLDIIIDSDLPSLPYFHNLIMLGYANKDID